MNETTNYIVRSTAVEWWERYIFPAFSKHMEDLSEKMDELGYEPILVVGKDGE